MIEFSKPGLSFSLSNYIELAELWENCSSCVGFCVSLGETFFSTGIKEIDDTIRPLFSELAAPEVLPRVIPSYAILYWFSLQVYIVIYSTYQLVTYSLFPLEWLWVCNTSLHTAQTSKGIIH